MCLYCIRLLLCHAIEGLWVRTQHFQTTLNLTLPQKNFKIMCISWLVLQSIMKFNIYCDLNSTSTQKRINIENQWGLKVIFFRHLFISIAVHHVIGLCPDDTIYCYLPMYHSSGGQLGIGSSLAFGATTVIKKKFSASAFWKDCVKFEVTVWNFPKYFDLYLYLCEISLLNLGNSIYWWNLQIPPCNSKSARRKISQS